MANNQYVNKVVYNDSTLIDLTEDTVTPESLLSGYTAHDRSGAPINGTAVIPTKISDLQDDVGYLVENDIVNSLNSTATDKALSANMGYELGARLDRFSTDTGIIWRLKDTDINTIKQTGNYYATNDCPNVIPRGGYLTVLKYDDSYVVQIMYSWDTAVMYVRVLNNGVWLAWQRITRENDIVNNLTSTSTNVPLSAAQGKALNEKFGYWTISDTNTLTANYVTYNTRSGRKFSDYDMLAITPDFGGWWTNGLVIPLSNFIGASGVALFYYDGSNRIEIDVKYQSDTSFQAKYIGNPTSNIHVNIFGFMPT